MPKYVYRWQGAKTAESTSPGRQGIPTAVSSKAALNMGAVATDVLAKIDRDAVERSLSAKKVASGWYEIVGSREAGWEFKIWVSIPAAAITWAAKADAKKLEKKKNG